MSDPLPVTGMLPIGPWGRPPVRGPVTLGASRVSPSRRPERVPVSPPDLTSVPGPRRDSVQTESAARPLRYRDRVDVSHRPV